VKRLGFGILGTLLLMMVSLSPVLAQDSSSAEITSPITGEPLFGLVNIMGTASHAEMQRYTLEFDLQDMPSDQWFTIAGPISQQVQNGILAQWNTTTVPDGRYQIRLRVVLRDGTVMESIVQNLRVSNREPTSLPTGQPSATPELEIVETSVGPSPTPLIQQPPTVTPRPTAFPTVIATLSASGGATTDATLFDQLGSACCNGALIAFVISALVGAYSTIHGRLRPMVYRLIRMFRNDVRG
jgi:hypothetical protein